MHARSLFALAAAALLGAGSAALLRPSSLLATPRAERTEPPPQRFQLTLLPTGAGERPSWLLLDTSTGHFSQWTDQGDHFDVVDEIAVGRTLTYAARVPKGNGGAR